MKNIITKINNFDYHYEMSDDSKKWDQGKNKQREIQSELNLLTPAQLKDVVKSIKNLDLAKRYFNLTIQKIQDKGFAFYTPKVRKRQVEKIQVNFI